ncbi:SRPBCC domain-containing protein [Nonomuraea sp. NPDC049714]|uniref:SRPBCC domain-containing protein n=1 Tax=Nonomuraea sp. NPDC049714 TaxID=3364357 RepID=UPI00378A3803
MVGPEGFTTTTRLFEFRVGGEWDFVMQGPDGTDYQEWITWTEIVPPERIALLHGEYGGDPNAFESVLACAPDGAATRIEMRTVAAYVTEIVRKGAGSCWPGKCSSPCRWSRASIRSASRAIFASRQSIWASKRPVRRPRP